MDISISGENWPIRDLFRGGLTNQRELSACVGDFSFSHGQHKGLALLGKGYPGHQKICLISGVATILYLKNKIRDKGLDFDKQQS